MCTLYTDYIREITQKLLNPLRADGSYLDHENFYKNLNHLKKKIAFFGNLNYPFFLIYALYIKNQF